MRHTLSRLALRVLPAMAIAASAAIGIAYAVGLPEQPQRIALAADQHDSGKMTDAASVFPDAPHGVDPMVTGPRTAAFKAQQKQAGCEQAVWPNIPAACFPGR